MAALGSPGKGAGMPLEGTAWVTPFNHHWGNQLGV